MASDIQNFVNTELNKIQSRWGWHLRRLELEEQHGWRSDLKRSEMKELIMKGFPICLHMFSDS